MHTSKLTVADRRIAQAFALSVVLHVILLATMRLPPPDAESLSALPNLLLRIEAEEDGSDSERESPPPVARSSSASEPQLEPEPVVASSLPSQEQIEAPAAEAVEVPSVEAPGPAILTTESASYREEPVAAEPERTAITATQQAMLNRRIAQGAQSLQVTESPSVRMSWQEEDRNYVAMLTLQPARDGMDMERAMVEIETEQHGQRLRTRMQMKRLAFSHFTQFVDRWDPDIQLHDDVIAGRFHSNSAIVVAYDRKIAPLFLGKVTTAARNLGMGHTIGRRKRDDIFPQGLETKAERVKFPDRLHPVVFHQNADGAEVRSFTGDTRIAFFPDGSYDWSSVKSNSSGHHQMNPDAPTYIVGTSESTLYVRGIVRGKVLVYSPERIVVEDDLTYARDPRSSPESNDYLGLVSDRYIEIPSPRVTGPGDLKIQAAVYAKRRFIVTHVAAHKTSTLSVYGSLTAGSLSETEPRYATYIEFDPRFERLRPPGFPLTNKYEVEAWDPHWQRVDEN